LSLARKKVPVDISCMISSNEKVLWAGEPDKMPLVIQCITSLVLGIGLSFALYKWLPNTVQQDARYTIVAFGLLVPLVWSLHTLYQLMNCFGASYVITSQRLILKQGFFSTVIKAIDFREIKKTMLVEGFLDKLFGVASIYVDTGEIETYEVVQANNTVKTIKKRTAGDNMRLEELHEEKGPDIIREKTRKVYFILSNLKNYAAAFRTLQQARNAYKG